MKTFLPVLKRVVIIFVILCVIITVLLVTRFIYITVTKNKHTIDSDNGIDEVAITNIGGIDQYLYIRGQNKDNPVILLVHGGMPMIPMIQLYQYEWEKDYTVVNWDRRNSGESYFLNRNNYDTTVAGTISPDTMISDIGDTVDYLYKRFENRKIIILADSMGTTFASRYVMEHPEKVACYIGSAQLTDFPTNMERFSEDLKKIADKAGDTAEVDKIAELENKIHDDDAFLSSYQPLMQYGNKYISGEGVSNSIGMIFSGLTSPYFSVFHLSYYFKSEDLSAPLLPYLQSFNINEYGNEYEVPVAFIIGENDFITRYAIEDYYDLVNAPHKQIYYVSGAGHDALQQNPHEFYRYLNTFITEAMPYVDVLPYQPVS